MKVIISKAKNDKNKWHYKVIKPLYEYISKLETIVEEKIEIEWRQLSGKAYQGQFTIRQIGNNWPIAEFSLVTMPGCCGIVISTGAAVNHSYRNKGIGKILHQARIDLAKYWGYGMLFCTDVETNKPQRKILEKNKWKELDKFVNPRTGNTVLLHGLLLT